MSPNKYLEGNLKVVINNFRVRADLFFYLRSCKNISVEKCTVTPRKNCQSIPKKQCKSVGREQCSKVPRAVCRRVPTKNCQNVPKEIPRDVCETVELEKCYFVENKNCKVDILLLSISLLLLILIIGRRFPSSNVQLSPLRSAPRSLKNNAETSLSRLAGNIIDYY